MEGKIAPAAARISYVDMLRGLAVFGMFVVHTPAPWMRPEIVAGGYGRVISQISGMIAPVFLFLAGVSAAVIACRAAGKGGGERFRGRIARRGFEVLLAGYGLNLAFLVLGGFSGGLALVLKVDVLHCIGAALALSALLVSPARGWNAAALIAAIVLVLGAQITWRAPIHGPVPAGVAGYLTFIPGASRFPLLPYAGWVALGAFVGQRWWRAAGSAGEGRFFAGLAAAGAACFAAGFLAKWAYYRYGVHALAALGPAPRTTVHHFLFKAGIVFGLFALARLAAPAAQLPAGRALVLFGRTSLFAYCVHLVLAYHAFGPLIRRSLGPPGHAIGVAALTVVMWGLCRFWAAARARPAG